MKHISQIKYLFYFQKLLNRHVIYTPKRVILQNIQIGHLPPIQYEKFKSIDIAIYNGKLHESPVDKVQINDKMPGDSIFLSYEDKKIVLKGDIYIIITNHLGPNSSCYDTRTRSILEDQTIARL